jgi:hypothetical protein
MTRSRRVVLGAAAVVGLGVAVAGGAIFLDPARAAVGPLPGEALVLPADAKFVGGFDVKRFVASPFYARFLSGKNGRLETFREVEEKTGLNPERDLDMVIIAGTPGGSGSHLAVVIGRFDRARIAQLIETEKKGVTWKNVQGVTVYLFKEGEKGAGAIAFLDDRTLVVGGQAAVEAAAAGRSEQTLRGNATIMELLGKVKPGSTFWMVGDQSLLANMPKNVPAGGGQSLTLPGLKSLVVSGDVDPMIAVEVNGEAADEAAAKNLADVVRGFVALAALQANQKPELKELASAISVTQEQKNVRVNARVPYEMLDALQASTKKEPAPAAPAK